MAEHKLVSETIKQIVNDMDFNYDPNTKLHFRIMKAGELSYRI